nr:MAG TPA: hypothetical protein [Caudoviricetes sp.]
MYSIICSLLIYYRLLPCIIPINRRIGKSDNARYAQLFSQFRDFKNPVDAYILI